MRNELPENMRNTWREIFRQLAVAHLAPTKASHAYSAYVMADSPEGFARVCSLAGVA